jgi:hypothetical protein
MASEAEIRARVANFDFSGLFIEALGWDHVVGRAIEVLVGGATYLVRPVAHKRGMTAYVCESSGPIPTTTVRREVEKRVAKLSREHIVVFVDTESTAQVWQWVRREPGQPPRPLYRRYGRGQRGDSLVQKLVYLAFSIQDEEDLTIVDVAGRARQAFNVDRVTKAFYERFRTEHDAFLSLIGGIREPADREWYASLMLNRLMFVYFLEKKGFLEGERDYLRHRLDLVQRSRGRGAFQTFYRHFLRRLFHEGLGSPPPRDPELAALIGQVPYLNGGLFEIHELERNYPGIDVPDEAFGRLFDFFDAYQWHLDDRPLRADNEINPDVLGYIFEKFINQRLMGAYYTREDITGYMASSTILPALIDALTPKAPHIFGQGGLAWDLVREDPDRYIPPVVAGSDLLPDENERERVARLARVSQLRTRLAEGAVVGPDDALKDNLDLRALMADVLAMADIPLAEDVYGELRLTSVLDPTCGSGAFLFAALNVLRPLYDGCLDVFEGARDDGQLTEGPGAVALREAADHPNRDYFVIKSIIVSNLFGVDIMEEAVEIAKLRLFLKLVAEVTDANQLEPLPDIDFNIRAGNSLVGFATLRNVRTAVLGDGQQGFDLTDEMPAIEKATQQADQAFDEFRRLQLHGGDHLSLRAAKASYRKQLGLLRSQLDALLAGWRGAQGEAPVVKWIADHRPFHWFVEFYGILRDGGFRVVIGNPPYVGFSKLATSLPTGVGTPFATLFRDYKTVSCGNLYAICAERTANLIAQGGWWSLIVPLSLTFSEDFGTLRKLLLQQSRRLWYSSYDNIPDRAFTGAKESDNTSTANQQRVTIFVADRNETAEPQRYGTPILRWRSTERERLFADLPYEEVTDVLEGAGWPKIGATGKGLELLRELRRWPRLTTLMVKHSAYQLAVPKTASYFVSAFNDPKERSQQAYVHFRDAEARSLASVILNSDFFFWWNRLYGDSFHITRGLLETCPMPRRPNPGFEGLAKRLDDAQGECTVYKAYRGEQIPNVNYNLRMDLLLECDRWVASHLTGDWEFDWEGLLRYKSSSWFSFEIAKSAHWPAAYGPLGLRGAKED